MSAPDRPPSYSHYLRLLPHQRGLLYSEYLAFELHRKTREEARAYLGAIGAAKLALRVNTGSNRRGLVADKFLFDGLMRGFDLPSPPLQAVWRRPARAMGFASLGRVDGLRAFLAEQARFPLFVKPSRGSGGEGCLVITGFDAQHDTAELEGREDMAVPDLARHLSALIGGALIQTKLTQHPSLVAAVGPTIATLRIYSYFEDGRASIKAALWRVPRTGAITDNARSGGMLASVDPEHGRVGPVRTSLGQNAEWCHTHPDTGAALTGMVLPHWQRVGWIVARAGALLHELPLIGWDIALGPDGPIIVEANASPSLDGLQYVADHGVLDSPFGQRLRKAARRNQAQNRARRRGLWPSRLSKLRKLMSQ